MPPEPANVGVLIPAGGRGTRAGDGPPKQFRPIAGIPMLLRAVRPFAQHPRVRQIVIALPPQHAAAPPEWLADLTGERLRIVPGGETRQASVRCALGALDPGCTVVLVHDAARPFVRQDEIDAVIAHVSADRGALVGIPVADTLKRTTDEGRVVETIPRERLWRAQTPQGFPRALFEQAHRRSEAAGDPARTDDAALVEACGATVMMVRGHHGNLKLTTPEDFALAEALVSP